MTGMTELNERSSNTRWYLDDAEELVTLWGG